MTMPELPDDPALLAMLEDFDRQMTNEPDLVDKARESLEETIKSLKLTPEEERAMADELRQLRELSKKLDDNTVEIAAFGMVSRGKSSVLNALLGQRRLQDRNDPRHHRRQVARTDWEQATAERPGLDGAKLILVDTPGIDEVGGEGRESMRSRRRAAGRSDPVRRLQRHAARRDRGPGPASRGPEADHPRLQPDRPLSPTPTATRSMPRSRTNASADLIRPEDVVMTAARPDPFRVKIQGPDGKTTIVSGNIPRP